MNRSPSSPSQQAPDVSPLAVGQNCWAVHTDTSARFLVDSQEYYADLDARLETAEHSIFIIGWDFDSRTHLVRGSHAPKETLGQKLNRLAREKPDLHIYILIWDFVALYAFDREPVPTLTFAAKAHPRIRFRLDDQHPVMGSHHQKIVVMDDRVAWCGGMDITSSRWDTPAHAPEDPLRKDARGEPYGPVHDVQLRVTGPTARKLGELVRGRWRRATGERLAPAEENPDYGEPSSGSEDGLAIRSPRVAISRTQPAYLDAPEIREIETQYLDLIRYARRWIYIENQYFATRKLADAVIEHLQDPEGPEVVIVLPSKQEAWLEDHTMGALRNKILTRLFEGDTYKRLSVFYPKIRKLREGLNVHSKVMVIDDRFAVVGSANLNNRSLGFDTECNLTCDGTWDPQARRAIHGFMGRLLGEHIGLTQEETLRELGRLGSLRRVVQDHRRGHRRLVPYRTAQNDWIDEAVIDFSVVDPSSTWNAEVQFDRVLTTYRGARMTVFGWSLFALGAAYSGLVLLMSLVGHPELGESLPAGWWSALSGPVHDAFHGRVLAVVGLYVLGACLFAPLNILLLAGATLLSWEAALIASSLGCLANATVGYGLGAWLKSARVSRFLFANVDFIEARLGRARLMPIIYTRILLWIPFPLVNVAAGSGRVGFGRYLAGTLLGVLPGLVLLTSFQRALLRTLGEGSIAQGALAVALLAVIFSWTRFCHRRYSRIEAPPAPAAPESSS